MKSSAINQKSNISRGSVKGFTLIELLVVMAIIAGLAGIGCCVDFVERTGFADVAPAGTQRRIPAEQTGPQVIATVWRPAAVGIVVTDIRTVGQAGTAETNRKVLRAVIRTIGAWGTQPGIRRPAAAVAAVITLPTGSATFEANRIKTAFAIGTIGHTAAAAAILAGLSGRTHSA